MNKSPIEWTDFTWNPVTGCKNTCPYCYARKMVETRKLFDYGFAPTFHADRLEEPGKEKKPKKIFVCSMADLFGSWVPDEWILKVIKVAIFYPRHTFQFLTKNPWRYNQFKFPDNCELGATITGDDSILENMRMQQFATIKYPQKFVSIEPLLWSINPYVLNGFDRNIKIYCGAQTGTNAVEPCPEWIESVKVLQKKSDIPILWKKNIQAYMEKYEKEKQNGQTAGEDNSTRRSNRVTSGKQNKSEEVLF